jgi:hypothetical protein
MATERMTVEEELKGGETPEETEQPGGESDVENPPNPEAGETEPDATGETGADAGAEGEEVDDRGAGDDEPGTEEKDGGNTGIEGLTALVGQLTKQIDEMKRGGGAQPANTPWTPERWAQLEADTGLREPAVKWMVGEIVKPAMDSMAAKYEGRLARIEQDYVMNDLAGQKGF